MTRRTVTTSRSVRGATLIEVLAAVSLFSIIAVGLTGSTVSCIKRNHDSRTIAAATALVQNKLEQIRLIQPVVNVVPADLTTGVHQDASNPLTPLGGSGGTFTRTWTVTRVPQYLNGTAVGFRPGITQVAVTVSWTVPSRGRVTGVTYACITPTCG